MSDEEFAKTANESSVNENRNEYERRGEEVTNDDDNDGGDDNGFAQQLKRRALTTNTTALVGEEENDDKKKAFVSKENSSGMTTTNISVPVQMMPRQEKVESVVANVNSSSSAAESVTTTPAVSVRTTTAAATADKYLEMQAAWSKQIQSLQSSDREERMRQHHLLKNSSRGSVVVGDGDLIVKRSSGDLASGVGNTPTATASSLAAAVDNPSIADQHLKMQTSWSNQIQSLQSTHIDERARQHHNLLKNPEALPSSSQVFGAWSQIESLQQRLKEAEERADRESRRAELAEKVRDGGSVAAKEARSEIMMEEEGYVGDLNIAMKDDDDAVVGTDRVYKAEESGESFVTVGLGSEENSLGMPSLVQRQGYQSQSHCNNSINSRKGDNEELLRWKQRAIQAEERLSKQDHTALISPHGSTSTTTTTPFHSPTKNHHHHHPHPPAVESDLIQLKNREIQVLRHQITRLELQIQEQSTRNAELIQSYHHHHDEPPIAVAECASLTNNNEGSSNNSQEFQMLRNEIRNLQYQLSQKNNNRSTQSTTGSTLSSLENEQEDDEECEEEEEEEVGKGSSSWGLCCVRRGRRGYGRVSR